MKGFEYLRNTLGAKLSDEDMQTIRHSHMEMYYHVMLKDVQAFALLGMVVIAPAVQMIRGPRTWSAVQSTALKYGKVGAVLGVPAGFLMMYQRAKGVKMDEDGYLDRCYRLRKNRNQVRVDRGSYLGAVAGVGAAVGMGASLSSGAVAGLVGGTILASIYNTTQEKHI
eukprot:gene3300-3783_t